VLQLYNYCLLKVLHINAENPRQFRTFYNKVSLFQISTQKFINSILIKILNIVIARLALRGGSSGCD
jgi:hypothetical protein